MMRVHHICTLFCLLYNVSTRLWRKTWDGSLRHCTWWDISGLDWVWFHINQSQLYQISQLVRHFGRFSGSVGRR